MNYSYTHEAVQIEQSGTVENGIDLDHTAEPDQILVIHFVMAKQVGVVAEVPQEPSELPERFRRAIDASGEGRLFLLDGPKRRTKPSRRIRLNNE